ncbi:MAG: GNAT family N-acetyltransferase [Chloroflexota bacterium]
MTEPMVVNNNQLNNRFEIIINSETAVLEYTIRDNSIIFTHTGVPAELEGKGLGSLLVKAGLEYADLHKLKVVPICWFVGKYLDRHPEFSHLL